MDLMLTVYMGNINNSPFCPLSMGLDSTRLDDNRR